MERLQSAMILHTPMHHPLESHIVEHPHRYFLELIRNGNQDGVTQMVLEGFDVDHAEAGHTPPLIHAIIHDHPPVIQTLLMYGANPNINDHHGQTPLHAAVKMKNTETLLLLMRYGANPLLQDQNGTSPLDIAKEMNDKRFFKMLRNISPIAHADAALFANAEAGNLHAIVTNEHLAEKFFQRNGAGQTLLHIAILSRNIKLISYLLNKGLDIDAVDQYGNTPLTLAAQQPYQLDVLKYLLKRHATIDHKNKVGSCALTLAISHGFPDYVDLLLDQGANAFTYDGLHTTLTLTHNAILRYPDDADKYRSIETRLLVKGVHVDIPINKLGWTPLIHLCTRHQDSRTKDHIELLIHMGANVNAYDVNGRTGLMLACSTGRTFAIDKLLDNYCNMEKIDNYGWNALMFAVYYNHHRIVHTLLDAGADVNATSERGLTPLKIATQHNHKQMIDLLLDFGAVEEDNNQE
jgi:serine/threonine-protein phosphatase 6 regulatory ankyrin repeat subunit B